MPFANTVPGFLPFLSDEKGLRQESQHRYIYTLRPFEAYLNRDGIALSGLEPAHISGFMEERAKTLHKAGMQGTACALRVFLRYLHREGIVATDLVRSVPRGRVYRQASIPRAIGWQDVERLLASIDRRSILGKRNYAILTLLASYGLRARRSLRCAGRFRLDECPDQHPNAQRRTFDALSLVSHSGRCCDFLPEVRRSDVPHRQVFLTARSPYIPMHHWTVSSMVGGRMRDIGIQVTRAGFSHAAPCLRTAPCGGRHALQGHW